MNPQTTETHTRPAEVQTRQGPGTERGSGHGVYLQKLSAVDIGTHWQKGLSATLQERHHAQEQLVNIK